MSSFTLPAEQISALLRYGVLHARVGRRLVPLRMRGEVPSRRPGCYLINATAGSVSVQITHTSHIREEKSPRSPFCHLVLED